MPKRNTHKQNSYIRTSKQARKNAKRVRKSTKQLTKPPSLKSFQAGQVLQVRVFYEDNPSEYKIRPAIYIDAISREQAQVFPVYSNQSTKRTACLQFQIGNRSCFVSMKPIEVSRNDILSVTPEKFELKQIIKNFISQNTKIVETL
tara:strand:+ start:106 stop:543 length:438 start_codon:yes stop_codon:yes gene_type:complete